MDTITMLFGLFLAIILTILLVWYIYFYAPFQVLKRSGIPHPPITPFIGNIRERLVHGTYVFEDWMRDYGIGKVVGFYIGTEPRIIIGDVEMLKEITVKQFDIFIDRLGKVSPLVKGARNTAPGLFDSLGLSWKKRRASLSPSFTTKKLKLMAPLVENRIDSLCERISELSAKEESIDFYNLYSQFTMETILAAAFGTRVDLLRGEGSSIAEAAKKAFQVFGPTAIWTVCISSQLPLLSDIFFKFLGSFTTVGIAYNKLIELSTMIVKARREQANPPKEKDFLQVLIESGQNGEQNEEDEVLLTNEDIVGTCIEFIMASHDTSTSTLSYTSYLLALNPDKQDKLRQEIKDYYKENKDASLYEAAHSIPYLEWVIQESMRRYAPAVRTMRYCQKTCTIKGVTIPKGSIVVLPIQYIHHCPDYWDQPYAFRPERFSPEEKEGRHPMYFMPFGWGPRSCIGTRFAWMEFKMTLLKLVKEYRFERAHDTQVPLKTVTHFTQSPANGIYLKVCKNPIIVEE